MSLVRRCNWGMALFCWVVLAGCGGGSKGTGGDELYGKVLFANSQPAANVEVTTLASGDSATTDEDGEFRIEADLPVGDVSVGIDTGTFSSTVTIAGVPAEDSTIRCVIELDAQAQAARLTDVTIGDRRTPTPTPRPSATPSQSPTGRPTGNPTSTPTQAPQASGTVTPSPTPASSHTPTPSPTPEPEEEEEEGDDVEVSGLISALTGSAIVVGGVSFVIDDDTSIHGQDVRGAEDLAVGMRVHAHGYDNHVFVRAVEIEVLESGESSD